MQILNSIQSVTTVIITHLIKKGSFKINLITQQYTSNLFEDS